MFCHICGKELEDGSVFCCYCGTKMPDFGDNQASDNCANKYEESSETELHDTKVVSTEKSFPETQEKESTEIIAERGNCQEVIFVPSSAKDETENKKPDNQSFIPRIIHDVNINLGRNAFLCVIIVVLAVISCVLIVECKPSTNHYTSLDSDSDFAEKNTPASFSNDEERWDAENGLYSNFKYGISFNLPQEMTWQKIAGQAEHTVVKFLEPNLQLAIFVNINPIDIEKLHGRNISEDIWDNYDQRVEMMSQVQKRLGTQTAETVVNYNYRRAEICGKHAIKSFYQSEFGDDRHLEKENLTTTGYSFIYNYCTVSLTAKCTEDAYNMLSNLGWSMDDILRSFSLIPISEKYIRHPSKPDPYKK